MRHSILVALVAVILPGCSDASKSTADARGGQSSDRVPKAAVLKKPIGIKTAGNVFTPLIEAGQHLPHTRSETFTNKTDGGPKVLVELSQKDESGLETITSLIISIPPVADNTLQITVTLRGPNRKSGSSHHYDSRNEKQISEQARERNPSWISARRSVRIRSFRFPCSHDNVRSTTQR